MSEPVKCEFLVFAGTYFDPPEYCPNDAEEGEAYCLDHLPPDEDEWDDGDLFDPLDWDDYEGTDE